MFIGSSGEVYLAAILSVVIEVLLWIGPRYVGAQFWGRVCEFAGRLGLNPLWAARAWGLLVSISVAVVSSRWLGNEMLLYGLLIGLVVAVAARLCGFDRVVVHHFEWWGGDRAVPKRVPWLVAAKAHVRSLAGNALVLGAGNVIGLWLGRFILHGR